MWKPFDANHVGKFWGKQKSHSETLGLHSLTIENIAKLPLSDVFPYLFKSSYDNPVVKIK